MAQATFGRSRSSGESSQNEQSRVDENSLQSLLQSQFQQSSGSQSEIGRQDQSGSSQNSGFSSGTNNSAQTGLTRSNFYAPAETNINRALDDAGSVYQNRLNAGSRIVGFDPYETGAQEQTAALAGNNEIHQAAYRQGLSEINGDYLGQDAPGLQAVRDRINRQVTQQVNSSVGAAGRTGSGAHQFGLAQGLAEGLGGVEYGNYQQERGRQVAARDAAGGLAGNLYADAERLGSVGADRRGLAQLQREDQIDSPQRYLQDFASLSGGIAGLAGSTEQQLAQSGQQQQFTRQDAINQLRQLSQNESYTQEESQQFTSALERLLAQRSGQSNGTARETGRTRNSGSRFGI